MKNEYDEIAERIGELLINHAQNNGERFVLEKCLAIVSQVSKKRMSKKDTVIAYSGSGEPSAGLPENKKFIRKYFSSYDEAQRWVMDTYSPEYTIVCPECGSLMGV